MPMTVTSASWPSSAPPCCNWPPGDRRPSCWWRRRRCASPQRVRCRRDGHQQAAAAGGTSSAERKSQFRCTLLHWWGTSRKPAQHLRTLWCGSDDYNNNTLRTSIRTNSKKCKDEYMRRRRNKSHCSAYLSNDFLVAFSFSDVTFVRCTNMLQSDLEPESLTLICLNL